MTLPGNSEDKFEVAPREKPRAPYPALAVCREIMKMKEEKGIEKITPLKLIKLVYLCHGFHLALTNKPLINEKVEAWKYGPVISSIYDAVSHYKKADIREDFRHIEGKLDDDALAVIDAVLTGFGEKNGIELSFITHLEDSPWDITVNKMFGNNIISDSLTRKYYKKMLERVDERSR